MSNKSETETVRDIRADYEFGFHVDDSPIYKAPKGLTHDLIDVISDHKSEPDWMRQFRHQALDDFYARPMPNWGADLSGIDFENIHYYLKPTAKQADKWEDLPAEILDTWDRLGIPEAEKKYLAGVGAQYESEVVYHKLQADLEAKGVIFLDMDSGLREHEELVRKHFATVIPPTTTSSRRSTRPCGRAARSSTCPRACGSRCRCRRTSGSTPRTWASSSGR